MNAAYRMVNVVIHVSIVQGVTAVPVQMDINYLVISEPAQVPLLDTFTQWLKLSIFPCYLPLFSRLLKTI